MAVYPPATEGVTGFDKPAGAKPAQIRIQDTGGVYWYLWVDTSGKLRISDTADTEETDFASGGTIVGAQTA